MVIDLIAIAPLFIELAAGVDLGVIRVLRIVRFHRLGRYVPALATISGVIAAEWRPLLGSFVLFMGLLLISGVLMYIAEGRLQPDKLGDVPSAMWWAVVTLSTVGYGDVVPVTLFGRLIAGSQWCSELCSWRFRSASWPADSRMKSSAAISW